MKLIDGDELLEILCRSDVSTREKIAEIVRNQPEIKGKDTKKYINNMLYLEKRLTDCIHQHIEAYLRNIPDDVYKHLQYIIEEEVTWNRRKQP